MSAPQRIQRKRTRDSRMPEGTIYVGRPTRWGNPYRVGDPHPTIGTPMDLADVVDAYRFNVTCLGIFGDTSVVDEIREHLAGHDLACYCPLDQQCHADVLLEIANGVAS